MTICAAAPFRDRAGASDWKVAKCFLFFAARRVRGTTSRLEKLGRGPHWLLCPRSTSCSTSPRNVIELRRLDFPTNISGGAGGTRAGCC